jgi:hypothetical protein
VANPPEVGKPNDSDNVKNLIVTPQDNAKLFPTLACITLDGSAWRPDIYDMAAWTSLQEEEVDFFDFEFDFEDMLVNDAEMVAWEKDLEMDDIEMVDL